MDMGVAFEGLAGEIYPAVAFYTHNQRVSLARAAFKCPGAGIAVAGSPRQATLDDVAEAAALMSSMRRRRRLCSGGAQPPPPPPPLPPRAVAQAHAALGLWLRDETRRCVTRPGYELEFDTSEAACYGRFGFRANDRVRTARGNGAVVGVCGGKLWVEVDGEEGAWFFALPRKGAAAGTSPSSAAVAAAAAGAQKVALTLISSAPPKNPIATAEDDESDAEVLRALRGGVTLPAFAELVDAARWSLDADADLAGAVNMHCDEKTLHPWNLPPCVVAKLLRALGTAQNGGIAPPDGDAKLRAALCRFAVLKLLNSKLVRAQARARWRPLPPPCPCGRFFYLLTTIL
jgi:hypothetical protein